MSQNPFTYGNPISDPIRFFGRKREIEQVYSRLKNVEFESSSIVGERRVGKTSLLKYLSHPEVQAQHNIDPQQYLFIYVDMQMVGLDTTPSRLWLYLLRQMEQQCKDEHLQQIIQKIRQDGIVDTFTLSELFSTVDQHNKHIIFLLDEFENITKNQIFGPDFFYGLRSLATHHQLALITSSRQELIDLTHSEEIRSSPFFNIFANINLGLFSDAETKRFIHTSLNGTSVVFTSSEITVLKQIAGQHPYFLQAACYFLFQAYANALGEQERLSLMKKEFLDEATPHMRDYWRSSSDQEKIVLTVLTLLAHQGKAGDRSFSTGQLLEYYSRSGKTLSHLEKRSLLTSGPEGYALLNETFGDWILTEITDTLSDESSYEEWLNENRGMMDRLSSRAKSELREILPQIASNYRDLMVTWLSDPKNYVAAAGLLKTVLTMV